MTLCEACTAYINESFIFGTKVYHPVGRPCGKVEPPKKNEPSEEAWAGFARAQEEICGSITRT